MDAKQMKDRVDSIIRSGNHFRMDLIAILRPAVEDYWDGKTHVIPQLNRLISHVYEMGMGGNKFCDWLLEVLPHQRMKDRFNKGRRLIGRKDKRSGATKEMAIAFILANPDPFQWVQEKDDSDREFDLEKYARSVARKMAKEFHRTPGTRLNRFEEMLRKFYMEELDKVSSSQASNDEEEAQAA